MRVAVLAAWVIAALAVVSLVRYGYQALAAQRVDPHGASDKDPLSRVDFQKAITPGGSAGTGFSPKGLRQALEPSIAAKVGTYRTWVKGAPADRHETVRVLFMLRRAPEVRARLEDTLMEVSTPGSARYGQHLSKEEAEALAPPVDGAQAAVLAWLQAHGVADVAPVSNGILEARLTVETTEAMLKTTLHRYTHRELGATAIRASTSYSVPVEVAWALYIVGDLVQLASLDNIVKVRTPLARRNVSVAVEDGRFPGDCGHACSGFTTPGVLRKAYDIPWPSSNQGSSMAIAQFQGVSYNTPDLNDFQRQCHLPWSLLPAHTYGYNNQKWCRNLITSEICLESLLDVEYIKGVGGDIPLTVISDTDYSLLRWAQRVGNMTNPAPLHSVSYGNDEVQQDSVEYMDAVNDQFMLLGVRGISILFASGDMGVYGRTGVTDDGHFHPDFPGSSPYLTAVGGTNFVRQGVIGPEESWTGSGGGFSEHFPMPAYQKKAVEKYLAQAEDLDWFPNESHFNRSNRGYPDVSALGGVKNPYCVDTTILFGAHGMMGVGGTSASCPAVAGIFAMLNAVREKEGMPSLGFLNPFIYQNADAFKDVKEGDNRWRGSEGFPAIKGWDPATGVGTPSYAELVKRVLDESTRPKAIPMTKVLV